jgi:hypothetical protein
MPNLHVRVPIPGVHFRLNIQKSVALLQQEGFMRRASRGPFRSFTTRNFQWVLASLVGLLCGAVGLVAQAPPGQAAALKESLAANQAALRQYSWVETTQIKLKGEVKKQEQKQCSYGADGKVQKTPIPGAAEPQQSEQSGGRRRRGGAAKEAIVANKVDDMKDYMERVAALVHEYVPPDPQKIQAGEAAGNLSVQPSAATTTLTVKDYVKPGDLLTLGFDASAKQLRTYKVSSYVEKPKDDAVALAVTFANLVDGTSYPQQVVLDVAAKNIQVTVTNSGYKKAGS